MLSAFLFAVVVDVFAELVLIELLYVYDFFQMSETIEGLKNNFMKCKDAFESLF